MSPMRWLIAISLAGLAIRLGLAPFFDGFGFDIYLFGEWAQTLTTHPFASFYTHAESPDHLPGDLWFLWGAARIYVLLGGERFEGVPFLITVKSISAIADVAAGIALFAIVRRVRQSDRLALIAAAAYVLNPAAIFMSAIWGQWDSISIALVLWAFWLALLPRDAWIAGMPLLAWALMIKPQLALLVPFVLLLPISRAWDASDRRLMPTLRTLAPRVVAAGAIAIAMVCALGLPFGVGLPGIPSDWPLLDRLDFALNLWSYTTMGAFNPWIIPIGSLDRWSDVSVTFLGLTPHTWGTLMLVVAYAAILLAVVWRLRERMHVDLVIWGMLAVGMAWFMLPTRVHERYLFPAFVLAILGMAVARLSSAWVVFAVGISASFLLNLAAVYWSWSGVVVEIGAFANIALTIWMLRLGRPLLARSA